MNKPVALLCLLITAPAAFAAVTCRLATVAGGVAFGPYETLSAQPADSALNVLVNCERRGGSPNVTLTLSLGPGTHGTSISNRRMGHAGGQGYYLSYSLFRDVSRSSIWGFSPAIDTVSQTLALPTIGAASATFTIFGRIPASQDVAAGNYADVVQISVTP